MEWSDELSVGIEGLDAQHRHLFELIDKFQRCVSSREKDKLAADALLELSQYAESHLQREELMLLVRRYPDYAKHKAEHDAYRQRVVALQTLDGFSNQGNRITNFLREWWTSHIKRSDQEYARYFGLKVG